MRLRAPRKTTVWREYTGSLFRAGVQLIHQRELEEEEVDEDQAPGPPTKLTPYLVSRSDPIGVDDLQNTNTNAAVRHTQATTDVP
jgi:hypothetical protein